MKNYNFSMIRIVGLTVAFVCFMFQSSPSLATATVPFINGMRLGTSFDSDKFRVGYDLIGDGVRGKAIQSRHDMSNMKFKMVKSKKDVSDVLDVSGELSVKVMAGLVDVQGKGSYLKSSVKSENSVEVLAQIYYRTVTKTITDDVMIPISNWRDKIGSDRHYVRSVTYGGYLIASLKYTAKKDETKEDIQASVEVNVNTKKVNVGIKGQFQSLAESANSVANLQISYTSSELPDNTPVDLDTILEEIKKFPEKIKKSTPGGIGVPIEVEVRELKYLQGNNDLAYVISGLIAGKVARFETMFADLETTYDAVTKLVTDPKHQRMDDQLAQIYGQFQGNIDRIRKLFYKAVAELNLDEKPGELGALSKAFEAYVDGDKGFVPGKYSRKLKRLQVEEPLPVPLETRLKKRQEKLKDQKMRADIQKDIGQLITDISSFENLFTGGDVTISFPKQSVGTYMIDRGSPEMDSIMACFSGKLTSPPSSSHIISYATTAHDNAFLIFRSSSQGALTMFSEHKFFDINKLGMNDGKLHGWCFYWDVTGIINVYKDGTKVDSSTGSRTENMPAGGTWVLGQDQDRVARRFSQSQAFVGEFRDVNIYGNFDKNYFKTVVGPAVSNLNTCKLKYKGNLIKSWDEFKMGFVGNYATMVKSSSCSN